MEYKTYFPRDAHQLTGKPASPRLSRSRSGAPAISFPETSHAFSRSRTQNRSRSTTKSRTNSGDHDQNLNPSTSLQKKQCWEKKDDLVRVLQSPRRRRRLSGCDGARKTRTVLFSSPSAWALSPGRSPKMELQPQPQPQPPKAKLVGSVFKYFRQKKVCPIREEEFHTFRILHNALVQWRWANARSEAAMAATNIVAQEKILGVWVRILKMRKSIVEGRIELQKMKGEIKLLQIVKPEIRLLNEWAKIERKNSEAVGKLATKLWGQATRLPFREGAKGDVMGVYNAMTMAVAVLGSIEEMLSAFFSQAEKTVDLLQQLITVQGQHNKWSQQLHKSIPLYSLLQARELSLRAHLIQSAMGTPACFTLITKYQNLSCFN